jgi:hypothetical protein
LAIFRCPMIFPGRGSCFHVSGLRKLSCPACQWFDNDLTNVPSCSVRDRTPFCPL